MTSDTGIFLMGNAARGFLALGLFVALSGGCGKKSDQPPTGRVTGKVTLNGEIVKTGSLMFVPTGGGTSAQGNIQSDGTFEMGTFSENDGAILGTHKVSITAIESNQADGGPGLPEDSVKDPTVGVKSLIPAHYGDLEKSGLKAEVKEGDNEINFELSDAKPGAKK